MNLVKRFSIWQLPDYQTLWEILRTNQIWTTQAEKGKVNRLPIDDWTQLDHFLMFGSVTGRHQERPSKPSRKGTKPLIRCIQADGLRVVTRTQLLHRARQLFYPDSALFVLALSVRYGNAETRQAATAMLPQVAETGLQLFRFLALVEHQIGRSNDLQRAVSTWYNQQLPEQLAFQTATNQTLGMWSHRTVLRLFRPKPRTKRHQALFHWIAQGGQIDATAAGNDKALKLLWVAEQAKRAGDEQTMVALIEQHNLPWQAVPKRWRTSAAVWRAVLPQLPLATIIRRLPRLTASGALENDEAVQHIVNRLTDPKRLAAARTQPMAMLIAFESYAKGVSASRKLSWTPVPQIVDALHEAVYLSINNVKPTGKRLLLGLDVSAKMATIKSKQAADLDAQVISSLMALLVRKTEKQSTVIAFDTNPHLLEIDPTQRLCEVTELLGHLTGGEADCTQPIRWALKQRSEVDAFVILASALTDAMYSQITEAIESYRQTLGVPAKVVVIAMSANRQPKQMPHDRGLLTVSGFDIATPRLVVNFINE